MSVIKMTDLDFKGKRVLICSDLNMPVKDGNEEPLASSYFNHAPCGSIYQAALTKVTAGNLVKVLSWFHNEWGFSNRMLDTTVALFNAK